MSMKRLVFVFTLLLASSIIWAGCAGQQKFWNSPANDFLKSGSIVLSHKIPSKNEARVKAKRALSVDEETRTPMAPLLGYFPPAVSFVPAENETWLELNKELKTLTLYKGKEVVKEIKGEGDVNLSAGDYFLQHKQKNPLWYAPNEYFTKRQMTVPPATDRLRYRRGALGNLALFATTTFPIHSAPVWTPDVGGFRISATELAAIYYMLPVGSPIVIK